MKTSYRLLWTQFGDMAVMRTTGGDLELHWMDTDDTPQLRDADQRDDLESDLCDALVKYFKGQPASFNEVATPGRRGTFFQRCWDECRQIPAGETITYAELANRAGSTPNAARAAGQAMRRNPLPIVIPCHRVVASDGGMGGYAGHWGGDTTGVTLKTRLLAHEKSMRA